MTRWYRAYEGTVTDAKLGEVALVAGCSRSVSIAAWHCILENCASTNERGRFDMTPRRCAVILQEPIPTIEAVFAEFAALGLIEGTTVSAWSKRQYESDSSTERVKRHRATSRNADETLQQRCVTPPETETETETKTEVEKPREALADLESKLRESAGWQNEPAPGLFVTGPIQELIDKGASLELDVLPVVRGRAQKVRRPSSWAYFVGPIQDAVQARIAAGRGPPPGEVVPFTTPSSRSHNGPRTNTIAAGFELIDRAIEQRERQLAAAQAGEGRGQDDPVALPGLRQGPG